MRSAITSAAFSSSLPPISPTITMNSVWSSAWNRSSASMNDVPMTGSPPMPMIVELPRPLAASSPPIWYVSVPERETRPIGPGLKTSAGMMPMLAMPGESAPGQFGPSRRMPRGRR